MPTRNGGRPNEPPVPHDDDGKSEQNSDSEVERAHESTEVSSAGRTQTKSPKERGGHDSRRILEILLGLIALLVGAYHVYELRHVRKSISTHYLGEFPEFLPNIREIVESARHDLVIACDFPGYGDFSDPDNALKYLQALRVRQSDKKLRIEFTCLDERRRDEYMRSQFPSSEWSNWKENEQQRAQVEEFLRLNGRSKERPQTLGELFAIMTEVDRDTLRQTFLNNEIQTSQHMPIYFWVADCRRAVFSIATPTEKGVEHAFLTSDHSLIKAVLELRVRYVPPSRAKSLLQPCEN